jgi:hypothetical protein
MRKKKKRANKYTFIHTQILIIILNNNIIIINSLFFSLLFIIIVIVYILSFHYIALSRGCFDCRRVRPALITLKIHKLN